MSFFVKVIPPHGRARIHDGVCKFCRDGRGMENQDKGDGPTYWHPAHPNEGLVNLDDAIEYMKSLGDRYHDTGYCSYCIKQSSVARSK